MKKYIAAALAFLLLIATFTTVSAKSENQYKIGDTDLDNNVTVVDATLIQLYLVEKCELSQTQKLAADTDGSQIINVLDASLIQKFLAQIITEFPNKGPQPVDEELLAIAEKIQAVQGENSLTFSVLSDVHFDKNYDRNFLKTDNIEKLGQLQDLVNVDFVANLGDCVVGKEDKQTTVSSLVTILDILETESDAPVLNARGNHDDNGWYTYGKYGGSNMPDEIINDKEWHDLALTNLPESFVSDENNPYGGYGYMDHQASKTRVFMLNSSDIPYVLNDDGSYRYNSYTGHAFSDYQLDFVADALHFADKENPADWAALFLVHVPLDTSNFDGERFGDKDALIRGHEYLLAIINAYKNGTAFKASGYVNNPSFAADKAEDFAVSVDVDYSEKGCGEVIAFMSGHTHANNYTNQAGMKNSLSYGYTFIGTVASENFTSYVINRDTNTVSAFSYGNVFLDNKGSVSTAPDTGTIISGEWSVKYDQFVPDGENLLTGLSQKHPMKYNICDQSSKIDLETLELDYTQEVKAARKLTKAIPVKPFTTYVIPDGFTGECLSFNSGGNKRVYITPTDHGDYKTITTGIRHYFILFSLDTGFYKDYENFYVKEMSYNLFN